MPVSDLQCAATLLVVRHAEATYAEPTLPSDEGGWLTGRGRQQAADLAEEVRRYRVAAVYSSELQRAAETAAVLAGRLEVVTEARPGLQEFSVGSYVGRSEGHALIASVFNRWLDDDLAAGCPGGETGSAVIQRVGDALQELADQHRGETVVVVSHGAAMSLAIPRLCRNAGSDLIRAHWVPHCAIAEISVDADGWLLRNWPGSRDPAVAEADLPVG